MTAGSLGQGWFDISAIADDVWAIGEPLQEQEVFSFLIAGSERAVLIDTGTGAGDIAAVVAGLTSLPVALVNSHSHWDHIGGNWRFSDISIHHLEAHWLPQGVSNARLRDDFRPEVISGPLPAGFDRETFAIPPSTATTLLSGGEVIDLGGRELRILHLPGHSEGGIALLEERTGVLFSTDVAYPAPLYAYGSDANWDDYKRSMAILADLAPSLSSVHGSHTGHTMSPDVLLRMHEAFTAIDEGRQPEEIRTGQRGDLAHHLFEGFSVLRPGALNEERGDV